MSDQPTPGAMTLAVYQRLLENTRRDLADAQKRIGELEREGEDLLLMSVQAPDAVVYERGHGANEKSIYQLGWRNGYLACSAHNAGVQRVQELNNQTWASRVGQHYGDPFPQESASGLEPGAVPGPVEVPPPVIGPLVRRRILPCPFCGGEGKAMATTADVRVECGKCGARGPSISVRKEDLENMAIERWNKR